MSNSTIDHIYFEIGGDLMARPNALCDLLEAESFQRALIVCGSKGDLRFVQSYVAKRGIEGTIVAPELESDEVKRLLERIESADEYLLITVKDPLLAAHLSKLEAMFFYGIPEPDVYSNHTSYEGDSERSVRAYSFVSPKEVPTFHMLGKSSSAQFSKEELPASELVETGRSKRLLSKLSDTNSPLEETDLALAQLLLESEGAQTGETVTLNVELLARLCRGSLQSSARTNGLGSEIKSEIPRDTEHSGDRRRQGRQRNGDSDRSRGRDRRDRDSRGRRGRDRDDRRSRRGSDNRDNRRPPNVVRLYIGQGSSQGLNEESFRELARDKAELGDKDIRSVSIREHYGFVDLAQPQANRLIEELHGTQHNGEFLPVEYASTLQSRRGPRGGGSGRRRSH